MDPQGDESSINDEDFLPNKEEEEVIQEFVEALDEVGTVVPNNETSSMNASDDDSLLVSPIKPETNKETPTPPSTAPENDVPSSCQTSDPSSSFSIAGYNNMTTAEKLNACHVQVRKELQHEEDTKHKKMIKKKDNQIATQTNLAKKKTEEAAQFQKENISLQRKHDILRRRAQQKLRKIKENAREEVETTRQALDAGFKNMNRHVTQDGANTRRTVQSSHVKTRRLVSDQIAGIIPQIVDMVRRQDTAAAPVYDVCERIHRRNSSSTITTADSSVPQTPTVPQTAMCTPDVRKKKSLAQRQALALKKHKENIKSARR